MTAEIVGLLDEGLGNTTWLVDLGDGRALVVDASRDLREVRSTARRRNLRVSFAADTHLHADFVTGGVDLAAAGAELLASASGRRAYPHRGLEDEQEVDLGGLTLRALLTPGHTDEHVSYLLLDGSRPLGVFTGGSLIVGAAARTDLLGAERAEELARAQWRSLQRLATLPDDVRVWPTHGAGSFCSAPPGAERSSTIGRERAGNALLRADTEQAFVDALLASLGEYPRYFDRLGERNRAGVQPLIHAPVLAALTPAEVLAATQAGGVVVDVRRIEAFAQAHLPGALSNELRPAFATWLGWSVPPETPVIIVRDAGQDPDEVLWQALKIGHDQLAGELAGGMPAWLAAGLPVASTELVSTRELVGRTVIDVRQPSEYATSHLPDAANVPLGDLADGLPVELPEHAAVMCGHGERAMTAAALLVRSGSHPPAVVVGGPADWAEHTGQSLARTP